jgi:hypothetical protein
MSATARSAYYLTLADWAKRTTPGGGIDEVIDVLSGSNPIIADANIMEGNLPTGHQFTHRSSDPAGSWRLLNYGVAPEKSTTEQLTDFCAILETYSEVDIDIAKLNGDEAAFRKSEDMAFISGLNDTIATSIFYANHQTDPEQPHGLSPRYNSLSTGYSGQTLSASGSGSDNTSIWFITWGQKTCSLIYPKGSQAGLIMEDKGQQTITDSSGLKHEAYVTRFQWKMGLSVIDYRYVIRICNIDVSDLTSDASSGADLLDKMTDAYYTRPTVDLGNMAKTFVYCNKTIAKFLHKQAQNKSNVNLSIDMPAGKPQVSFLDAPIRVCDAIISTEDTVS